MQRAIGCDDSRIYRTFYHLFGIDVLSAQSLGKRDAFTLANKINKHMGDTLL